MARISITYDGCGRFVDRDAWWYRVIVHRDDRYLGAWLGTMSGSESLKLSGRIEPDAVTPAAIIATAELLRAMTMREGIRSEWREEVEQIPLGAVDILNAALDELPQLESSMQVLEFDLNSE